jgi:hypothetical protein
MQKMIEERMMKAFEKHLSLILIKMLLSKEEKAGRNSSGGGGMRMMMLLLVVAEPIIKNVKRKIIYRRWSSWVRVFDKRFITRATGKMESETRIIGGYNCFKATIKPVNNRF